MSCDPSPRLWAMLSCLDLTDEHLSPGFIHVFFSFFFFLTLVPLQKIRAISVCRNVCSGGGWGSKTCHPEFSVFTHCNLVPFDLITLSLVLPLLASSLSVSGASMIYLGGMMKSLMLRTSCTKASLLTVSMDELCLWTTSLCSCMAWRSTPRLCQIPQAFTQFPLPVLMTLFFQSAFDCRSEKGCRLTGKHGALSCKLWTCPWPHLLVSLTLRWEMFILVFGKKMPR